MLIDPKKLVDLVEAYQKTLELLNELKALGFRYKELAFFDAEPGTRDPWWRGIGEENGIIHFPITADARSVAHEMGHGFYECLKRDYALPQQFLTDKSGEDFAEAIRWWVEQRLGPSQWQPRHTNVLKTCHHKVEEFKNWLRSLTPRQGGQPATGAPPTATLSPRPAPGSP
jgi:hypothetical protein